MVQQAPPEVGTVLDGYRFKGGDPSQESSWEPVSGPEAAGFTPLGGGWYRGPDGGSYQEGRNGAMVRRSGAPAGADGGKASPVLMGAEARGRALPNIGPLVQAERNLGAEERGGVNPVNRDWAANLLNFDIGPGDVDLRPLAPLARVVGGQDYQNFQQAMSTYESALLPIQSGATVTGQEAARQLRADFPAWGDSPETVRRKAANRMMRINGLLEGLGRPPAFTPEQIANPDLRSVDAEVSALSAVPTSPPSDGAAQPAPAGGDYGLRPGQSVPPEIAARFGQDGRVTTDEMLAAGWTPDHETGQWLPPGGSPPPAGPQGPQGGPPAPSGSDGYQTALGQEREAARALDVAGAGYGITDALTGEFNDELAFGAGYLTQGLGNIGRRLTGRDIEVSAIDRARAARDVMVENRQDFARERPVQNALGNALGAAAFGPQGAARTMLGRAAQGAGVGATYGMAGAEGNVAERLPAAATGAAIGAVATPLVEKVAAPAVNALARPIAQGAQSAGRFLGRQAGNVGNALNIPGAQRLAAANQPNPLASGIDRFADRMGADRVNALAPRLAERRAAGLDQADLIDVLDDGSVGRVRALSSRDTPARDLMDVTARRRRSNLPSRVERIAREEISQDTRPALQAIDELGQARRANASAIDAFGEDTVPIDPNLTGAMQSDLVRSTLRDAARRAQAATDPAERQAAERLTAIAEGRASMTGLTVREAQDISRALDQSATAAFRSGSPDGPVLRDLSRAIRQSARDNSPGYAAWLKQYGDDSDLMEAAATGRNFVSVSKDPTNARGTEAFVQRAQQAGPAEQAIQRAAAREAVETAASNPSGARTVLEGFADDSGQYRRAAAIGANADRLQVRAGAELDSLMRHQRANPRAGSETNLNQGDSADAWGLAGAVGDVLSLDFRRLGGRAMNAIRSRGFSDQEAETIVQAAIDPAQTDQLISMLAQRMSRREARNLARAIRYQITTSLPANQ